MSCAAQGSLVFQGPRRPSTRRKPCPRVLQGRTVSADRRWGRLPQLLLPPLPLPRQTLPPPHLGYIIRIRSGKRNRWVCIPSSGSSSPHKFLSTGSPTCGIHQYEAQAKLDRHGHTAVSFVFGKTPNTSPYNGRLYSSSGGFPHPPGWKPHCALWQAIA